MSIKLFDDKSIKKLSTNKYVKNVSAKAITYTDEFKRLFIIESQKGKFPREIFEEYGFDVSVIGLRRVKSSASRWRSAYEKSGINGLRDTRKGNSGKSNDNNLTIEEKYERMKIQNNVLKAENELLKKLEMMERRLRKK